MNDEGLPGDPSGSPAELAAKRLFERAMPVSRELVGPSSGVSKFLLKTCDAHYKYEPVLEIAISVGYATRLEQRDESVVSFLPPAPGPEAALATVIRSELIHDERFFASVFPLGEPIWDALLEAWLEEIEFRALMAGGAPLPDRALIEEAIKLGCVATIVEQSYGLSPRRITDPAPLYQQLALALAIPLFFFFRVVKPRLIASLLAVVNLAGNQPAQTVAIAMAAAVTLAEISQMTLRVRVTRAGTVGPHSNLDFSLWLVSAACGWIGSGLLIYSFF